MVLFVLIGNITQGNTEDTYLHTKKMIKEKNNREETEHKICKKKW